MLQAKHADGYQHPVSVADLESELHMRAGMLTTIYNWRGYGLLRIFTLLEERHGVTKLRFRDEMLEMAAVAFGERLPSAPIPGASEGTFELWNMGQWRVAAHSGRKVRTEKHETWTAMYGVWSSETSRQILPAEMLNTRVRVLGSDEN